ncbi:HlyD family secretion protein [Pleomorphomonas sp. NRK KF1]|uniref:HlyD family secretion protein n=1 Tax=Pleomorphomonas sp. NRK KF1 TaxID=2943000 RepID=UPI002044532B|nr:HlyD family secretion protein [Pleomorphomonas sp. NRK KF1]MCM5553010.1 HlyD family secretion protein [Pleomorphomonas sp. NRK KF1]
MSDTQDSTPASTTPAKQAQAAPSRKSRRSGLRYLLIAAFPLALVAAGGWYWVIGGRWASTDNAYVQQNKVLVAPEVEGRIAEVLVGQNQTVKPGDVLFRIDDAAYRIALEKADGAVALARLQVKELRTRLKDAELKAETARNTLAFQEVQFSRQEKLRQTGNATEAQYDSARHELDLARQAVAEAEQGVTDTLVALGGDADIATDKHPSVLGALAAQDSARLDLKRSVVRAPTTGTVSQVGNLQVGQYIGSGSPVMAIIDTTSTWVEANFKETDLGHMRPGQPAELTFDAYPDVTIRGHIDSFGGGTGAIFSLLPAQNATGNWVKVVQRVPVRIALDEPTSLPLKAGLSVGVYVDTGFVRPLPAFLRTALDTLGFAPEAQKLAAR